MQSQDFFGYFETKNLEEELYEVEPEILEMMQQLL
jgi:hypothetical protein